MEEHKNIDRLKEWVCPAPFNDFMILNTVWSVCCPEWVRDKHEYALTDITDVKQYWESNKVQELRETVSDGSYSKCKIDTCPRIQTVLNYTDDEWERYKKKPEYLSQQFFSLSSRENPRLVYLNFDEACNLKCKTCRLSQITNQNNPHRDEVPVLLETVERQFAQDVEVLNLDGAGDVFYSKTFREWLQNFDPSKYPKLEKLMLITNGLLFTEKMWNSMTKVRPYVKDLHVSVDAASPESYKDIRGGDWDILMKNVNFWRKIPTLEHVTFNMVVQRRNQHELVKFFNTFFKKFAHLGDRFLIYFTMVEDWGHLPKEEYLSLRPDMDVVKEQMKILRPHYNRIHSNLW